MDWMKLAEKSLAGTALTEAEARSVLRSPDDDLLPLVHAAFQVRQSSFGKRVKLRLLAALGLAVARALGPTLRFEVLGWQHIERVHASGHVCVVILVVVNYCL